MIELGRINMVDEYNLMENKTILSIWDNKYK